MASLCNCQFCFLSHLKNLIETAAQATVIAVKTIKGM